MAARPIIVVGDKTSHGGVVIEGSKFSDINGKGIARVADKVTCTKQGCPSTTVIVTGDKTCMIDGQAVSRHGDKTACGATLIASQTLTTDDFGGWGSSDSSTDSAESNASVTPPPVQTTGFNQHVKFIDSLTGAPIEDQTFALMGDGEVLLNNTSEMGLSDIINTGKSSQIVTYELKGIEENKHGK